MRVKGGRPVVGPPEVCPKFKRKGRGAEAVDAGALLQLDIGALIGRYGRGAKALATELLEEGLYALAATDLHSPSGAREWLERSLSELRHRIGERGVTALISGQPKRILAWEALVEMRTT